MRIRRVTDRDAYRFAKRYIDFSISNGLASARNAFGKAILWTKTKLGMVPKEEKTPLQKIQELLSKGMALISSLIQYPDSITNFGKVFSFMIKLFKTIRGLANGVSGIGPLFMMIVPAIDALKGLGGLIQMQQEKSAAAAAIK